MMDEDLILTLIGPAAGMSMRDISELKEYYDPILMSTGPTTEVLKHDILELMHMENEDRSNYWPIKGLV